MAESKVTTPEKNELTLTQRMQDRKLVAALAKVLPKNLKADRFVRQSVTLVRRQPDLLKCDPVTVIGGMIQAAELGLELSGVLGHCYLIPRWNSKRNCKEAVFQMGYKGYRELAYRSSKVTGFHLRTVRKGDTFHYHYGTKPEVIHDPATQRGEPTHFYAVAFVLGSQVPDFEVMSLEECRAWRMKYSPPPTDKPDCSAWATNEGGMCLKTVCGIVARRMPLSVEAAGILSQESEALETGIGFSATTEDMLQELGESLPEPEFAGGPEPEDPPIPQQHKP